MKEEGNARGENFASFLVIWCLFVLFVFPAGVGPAEPCYRVLLQCSSILSHPVPLWMIDKSVWGGEERAAIWRG